MKKYPFNVEKHAHDLMFQSNRAYNIIHDMEVGTIPFDEAEYSRLEKLRDDLSEVERHFTTYPISFLSGRLYGIAITATVWASEQRAATQDRKRLE